MSRREFQFSDGSSHKFWAVDVAGASQTVQFGRVGTAGQTQTKAFPSADAASKATDKLIAEKVKKGYAEVTAGTPTPAAKPATAKTAKQPAEPPPQPAVVTAVTRTIDLEPVVTQTGLPKPAAPPFTLADGLARLGKAVVSRWGWEWDWSRVGMPAVMAREEAQFWFAAMTAFKGDEITAMDVPDRLRKLPPLLAARMAKFKAKADLSLDAVTAALQKASQNLTPQLAQPLASLFTTDELLDLILVTLAADGTDKQRNSNDEVAAVLTEGFCRYAVPYLTAKQVQAAQARVRPALTPANWPASYHERPPAAFYLAARLGMSGDLLPVVRALPDDYYSQSPYDFSKRYWLQSIVLALGKPQLVEAELRRLNLPLPTPGLLRQWLTVTQFGGLDYARDYILRLTKKDEAEPLVEVFARVHAPEAAPHLLHLKLESKAPAAARQWLDEQVGNAVAGLIPVAAGRGKLAEVAVEYLREAKKRGHETLIRDSLKGVEAGVVAAVSAAVLDHEEKEYPPLDPKAMPAKLKAAFEAGGKEGKLPAWAAVTALPPIVVGGKKLADPQVTAVLEALQRASLTASDPLVTAVKDAADAGSLDAFAWKLFQLWQADGCPSKDKWAMAAVGLFGGDASALKLTPLVRNWPGESQHARAVFGLDCLRAIGSDTALMQLNGIAQKLKFKGLKQKAAEAMEAIATMKGLTRSQLEDRIVPDCDLDERGNRLFDFGPRQFRFVLGPGMKPMLKDADGKVKPDLPKPGTKDDAAKAKAATDDWKLMKKQVKEVAAIQAQRLEQAMVTGRRWPVADFETLLVKHPLMTNLVRLLLWGGYDAGGKLTTTFRVTEDQTFADAKDAACTLKGVAAVGIVHPLHLSEEQKAAWGEVFSDYEIVPPFTQLGRPIHRLEKAEAKADQITRFKGVQVVAPTLVFGLEKLGWVRGMGMGMDAGCFDEHSKPFPGCDVTAVVHYDGTVGFGYIDPGQTLTFETCYFVTGHRGPMGYSNASREKCVTLAKVDPVAVSEVLADLTALAAKGK